MSQLFRLIAGNDPRQLSFGLALWTRGMIQELIFRQFGVRLSVVSVGTILMKLGMSPQRPLCRAYEQDLDKVADWKEKTFPRIQARAKKEGAVIFFADEASVRTSYHAGTTWAPVGKTPVVSGSGKTRSSLSEERDRTRAVRQCRTRPAEGAAGQSAHVLRRSRPEIHQRHGRLSPETQFLLRSWNCCQRSRGRQGLRGVRAAGRNRYATCDGLPGVRAREGAPPTLAGCAGVAQW